MAIHGRVRRHREFMISMRRKQELKRRAKKTVKLQHHERRALSSQTRTDEVRA